MKLHILFLSQAAFLLLRCNASYFSSGWTPGQPVTAIPSSATPSSSASVETGPGRASPEDATSKKDFDWTSILTRGPMNRLFALAGINVTERLAVANERAALPPWNTSVPMITDDNFEDLIINEPLQEEDEKKRVWFIVVTMGAAQDPISNFVDEQYDGAYSLAEQNGDLPHVRWGRIDYMNVTMLTTQWFVWKAPVLVVAHNRGQTLRFYKPGSIRLRSDILYEFLKVGGWEETEPWSSSFAPGGSRAELVKVFSIYMTRGYHLINRVPKWVFLIVSGSLASFVINFMHSNSTVTPPRPKKVKPSSTSQRAKPEATTSVPTAAPTVEPSPRKRRTAKK